MKFKKGDTISDENYCKEHGKGIVESVNSGELWPFILKNCHNEKIYRKNESEMNCVGSLMKSKNFSNLYDILADT